MDRTIIKSILPIVAFLLAIGFAYGFKKSDDGTLAFYSGHKKIGLNCIDTNVICTADGGTVICKDASTNTLYRYLSSTNCPQQLWRPMPQ